MKHNFTNTIKEVSSVRLSFCMLNGIKQLEKCSFFISLEKATSSGGGQSSTALPVEHI